MLERIQSCKNFKMNKIYIILLSVLLSSKFIESKPRYGYGFWGKFVRSSEESSEESMESCVGCSETNIGNGYKNRNEIHYNYSPHSKQYQGHSETDQEAEEQGEDENQLPRGGDNQGYNRFADNGSQGGRGEENYNSQRPFRPNGNQIPMYQEVEENGGYRTTSNQGFNRFGGGPQGGGGFGFNNNQRPFRPNGRQIHINGGPNDYETNYNRNKPGDISGFGNGHDNRNTFNIHKKDIYIS